MPISMAGMKKSWLKLYAECQKLKFLPRKMDCRRNMTDYTDPYATHVDQ